MIEVPHCFEVVHEIDKKWILSREASERETDTIHKVLGSRFRVLGYLYRVHLS